MQLDSWNCFMSHMMICQISSCYCSITSYSPECWDFINRAEVQQLFLKCLLCSKIVFHSILLFFSLVLKLFSIFTVAAFAFIFMGFASFCSQRQSRLIISPVTALTQRYHSCHSILSLFTHNCTTSGFPLSFNTDLNTTTAVDNDDIQRVSPLFHSTNFLLAAYRDHSGQYQGFCLTHK